MDLDLTKKELMTIKRLLRIASYCALLENDPREKELRQIDLKIDVMLMDLRDNEGEDV